MGVDACIYFKTRHGDEPSMCDPLPPGCSVVTASKWSCDGATHEVDQTWRYYGPGYGRGPWPSIAAVLMALLASPNVETVWYFGDCSDGDEPFTPQRVLEFSAHYMAEGDRPYRGAYPSQPPQGASIKRSEWESLSPEARKLLHDRTRDYVLRQGQAAAEVRDKPLSASPQGASSLLPGEELVVARFDEHGQFVSSRTLAASPLPAPQEPIGFAPQAQIDNLVRNCQPLDVTLLAIGQRARGDRNVPIYTAPAPQEPADPEWSRERIEAAAFSLGMRYAAPAPVDPESQGSSEPRLSDRDLIDRFDL